MDLDKIFFDGNIDGIDRVDETKAFSSNMELNDEAPVVPIDRKKEFAEKLKKECQNFILKLFVLGKNIDQIKESVNKKYPACFQPENIENLIKRNDGLLGTIIVDCSQLEDKNEYFKIPSLIRDQHQFVINCSCPKDKKTIKVNNAGSFNAFIENDDNTDIPILGKCKKTALPILDSMEKYTADDAIKAINLLATREEISSDDAKNLLKDNKPIIAVKKAYQSLRKKPTIVKKAEKYDSMGLNEKDAEIFLDKEVPKALTLNNLNSITQELNIPSKIERVDGISLRRDKNAEDVVFEKEKTEKPEIKIEKIKDTLEIVPLEKINKINNEVVVEKNIGDISLFDDLKGVDVDIETEGKEIELSPMQDVLVFEKIKEDKLGDIVLNSIFDDSVDLKEKPQNIKVEIPKETEIIDIDSKEFLDKDYFDEVDFTVESDTKKEDVDINNKSSWEF